MAAHRTERRLPHVGGGRSPHRLLASLAVVLVVAGTTWFTGATFTSATDTPTTVRAAADYYAPKVAVTSPGSVVSGTVTVTATATDSGTGVASVKIERAVSGSGSWATLCTDTTSPYSCDWVTTTVADGTYQLRATAIDNAGSSTTSAVVTTEVRNAAAVDLATVPDAVRGTHTLSAAVTGAGSRTVTSVFQYRAPDTTTWTTICSGLGGTAPSCGWVTTGLASEVYDVRVVSTVGSTSVTDEQLGVTVDNTPPTVTVNAPSPMSGTVLVTSTPLDDDSGVARVELQHRQASLLGGAAWTSVCTVTTDPYRCALDTTKLTNGATYELRAIATDVVGNATTSAVITRQVSNGVASVTITSPVSGDVVRGTTTLTVNTSTPALTNVTGVRYERRVPGGAWSLACTGSAEPWSCAWDTTAVASGGYELQAIMTYTGGLTATSPVVAVTVDNLPLRALDVQARNSGTLGVPSAGDTLTFTYQGTVNLGTVKSGWTGGSTAVTVTLADKNVNPASASDRATFDVNLGTVTFAQNYVRNNRSATVSATMTATTSGSGSTTTTTITVTLGSVTSGSNSLRTATGGGTMRWTPLSVVRNSDGVASSTTPASESGALDSDL